MFLIFFAISYSRTLFFFRAETVLIKVVSWNNLFKITEVTEKTPLIKFDCKKKYFGKICFAINPSFKAVKVLNISLNVKLSLSVVPMARILLMTDSQFLYNDLP